MPFDLAEQTTPLNKLVHYIWVGGKIKDTYLAKIRATATKLPGWTVALWVSSEFKANQEAYTFNKGCIPTTFEMEKSLKFKPTELQAMRAEWSGKPTQANQAPGDWVVNYGAISDIIRCAILEEHGGVYIDTDCGFKKALPATLTPKFGFWAATGNKTSPASQAMSNCVMASVKDGVYIKAYRQWINTEYAKVVSKTGDALKTELRGPSTDVAQIRTFMINKTLRLSGPTALQQGVVTTLTSFRSGNKDWKSELGANGCKPGTPCADLKFPAEYLDIGYDNSWLPPLVVAH